ncbi:MAG: hypothetical protein ACF8PN_10895 [Phycisphaerales bacterium]
MHRLFALSAGAVTLALAASATIAEPVVIDFEDLDENFYGRDFTHQGVRYYDLNTVSGVFPNGDPFGPEPNDEVIIEDATLFYDDYPNWGSPDKTLTFGPGYIVGDNLSLGRLSTVMMDLESPADSIWMDVAFYENGPWGGIVFHLDAMNNGVVVATDEFQLSDLGGRDNIGLNTLSVDGVVFDQVHLYATYGEEYSLPRIIIDDLTINFLDGGPSLTVAGDCPGQIELGVSSATPNGTVAFVFARNTGSITIPSGPCAGTALDLDSSARLVDTVTADASGDASLTGNAPAVACGGFVQAVDVASCTATNVAQL